MDPTTFGEIVRHDIKDNRVVGSRMICPGKARAAFIDTSGERVVFIKLDGRNYFYRPRWSANSDKWVVMTHGMD